MGIRLAVTIAIFFAAFGPVRAEVSVEDQVREAAEKTQSAAAAGDLTDAHKRARAGYGEGSGSGGAGAVRGSEGKARADLHVAGAEKGVKTDSEPPPPKGFLQKAGAGSKKYLPWALAGAIGAGVGALAAAAAGGAMLGSALLGGGAALGAMYLHKKGDTAAAVGVAAGAIAGLALGGPVGGLIGAIVGGLGAHLISKFFYG